MAIAAISVDSNEESRRLAQSEGYTIPLLSDADAKVSAAYGSVMEYNGAKLSARNTFVIDPTGKVAKVFVGVKPGGHSEEVLTALADLQRH